MKIYAFFVGILMLFISCGDNEIQCVRVSNDNTTENRDVSGFSKIYYNGGGTVLLSQGTEYNVSIEAPPEVISTIKTEVRDDELIINFTRCFNGGFDLIINITLPELDELVMTGTGYIEGSTTGWDTDSIYLEASSTGNISLDIDNMTTVVEVTGSGNVNLTGQTHNLSIFAASTAYVSAYECAASDCDIVSNTSANNEIYVLESLYAEINKGGNIFYKGTPEITVVGDGTGALIDNN